MKYLYCVAKNGVCSVRKYEVIKETPKTYVINGGLSARILKSTMSNKFCVFFEDEKAAREFYESVKYNPNKPKTNFDRIKAMSVEEMAEYIFLYDSEYCCYCIYNGADHSNGYDCREGIQKWLESEVEE